MADHQVNAESDKDSLNDWMLVEDVDDANEGDEEELVASPPDDNKDGEVDEEEEEEEADEEEVEGEAEEVEAIGQKLEEIKGDEADNESVSSSDLPREERIRKRRSNKSEATQDEETDLSLLSNPSLPDDLPQIKPEAQYVHVPHSDLNHRLNMVVALTLACVLGLGVGHFLGLVDFSHGQKPGWSTRTLWESNLNARQVLDKMEVENSDMDFEIERLQALNISPIKIKGKDGRNSRELREEINNLITVNEELRTSITKLQLMAMPDLDRDRFTEILDVNHRKRLAIQKLTHLVSGLDELKASSEDLQAERDRLMVDLTQVRFQEQALPRELNGVVKEIEGLKQIVKEASKKKNPPSNLANAKSYIAFMSQVFSAMSSIHTFNEGGSVEKLEVATDVFAQLAPRGTNIPAPVQDKVKLGRKKFESIKSSLASKWDELKRLTRPETISSVGHATLTKMNRVIVNVVNKVKEIGHASFMRRGKTPVDKSIGTLADTLGVLDDQFGKAWDTLEAEILLPEEQQSDLPSEEIPVQDMSEDTESFDESLNGDEDEETKVGVSKNEDKAERIKKALEEHQHKGSEKPSDLKITRPGSKENLAAEKEVDIERTKRELKEAMKAKTEQDKKDAKGKKKGDKKGKGKGSDKTVEEGEGRYFKGQYNKYDKNRYTSGDDAKKDKKISKYEDDDDDDDDDNEIDISGKKKEKQSGVMKHWGKPQKKSFFRDAGGPKKKFITRKGKDNFKDVECSGDKCRGKNQEAKDKTKSKGGDKEKKEGKDQKLDIKNKSKSDINKKDDRRNKEHKINKADNNKNNDKSRDSNDYSHGKNVELLKHEKRNDDGHDKNVELSKPKKRNDDGRGKNVELSKHKKRTDDSHGKNVEIAKHKKRNDDNHGKNVELSKPKRRNDDGRGKNVELSKHKKRTDDSQGKNVELSKHKKRNDDSHGKNVELSKHKKFEERSYKPKREDRHNERDSKNNGRRNLVENKKNRQRESREYQYKDHRNEHYERNNRYDHDRRPPHHGQTPGSKGEFKDNKRHYDFGHTKHGERRSYRKFG